MKESVPVFEEHSATIATAAPDLPFREEEEALLRTEIEVSDLLGIDILNGSAALAAKGTIGSLACTMQNQRHMFLVFVETAKLKTTENNEVPEQGRALQSRHCFSK